jgi:hypothetical protein
MGAIVSRPGGTADSEGEDLRDAFRASRAPAAVGLVA